MNVFKLPVSSICKFLYQKTYQRSRRSSSFLTGTASNYIEDMYNAWLKDPASVHVSWDSYFRNTQAGVEGGYTPPPNLAPPARNEVPLSNYMLSTGAQPAGSVATADARTIQDHLAVQSVIRIYQAHGHLMADLDPVKVEADRTAMIKEQLGTPPREILQHYNLSDADMNKSFMLPMSTFIGGKETSLPLKDILKRLEDVYCGHVGVECSSIDNIHQRAWIRQRMETPGCDELSPKQKRLILARLVRATGFEYFLAKKWPTEKRFGLEGCEMLIPAIKHIIDQSSGFGVDTIIIGVAHRGRLNLLANVCRKPLQDIFTQFAAVEATDTGSGDVKYHLGTYTERLNRATNKTIRLAIIANPSHLEAVDPVVQGRTRAEQFYRGDTEGNKVMSILIHGDASFCGQGIVYETMHLSDLPCYTTRGTIHIVVNNQVGFTTDPRFSRSSPHCTDVGHVVNAPIVHVNSDNPEKVIHACNVAAEWRAHFHKDVILDLVCYRKNGHNEGDEPMFTQPLMYTKIKKLKPILELYSAKLIGEGIVTKKEVEDTTKKYDKICQDAFEAAGKETQMKFKDWIDSPWHGFFEGSTLKISHTGVSEETLLHIGKKFSQKPPEALHFVMHRGLDRILKMRMDLVKQRQADWALGEAFAFGSLLRQGIHVRLSGQDVERGTFSHRHHVLHHQTQDKNTYNALTDLYPDQAKYTVCNSSLSEFAVLGFELGYSMTNPNALIVWEAQFGDFMNTAQCTIDTCIASGETKWIRQSGIVLFLPHGFDGMGPEHSSCRVERFLQMSDDDPDVMPELSPNFALQQLKNINWIVANCTTPANLFHILRRQIVLPFRKPLVHCSPKNLLRHPDVKSSFDDFLENSEFKRVIPASGVASQSPNDVKKLIFCSGKIYYELANEQKNRKLEKEIAIARVEQICPFPYDLIKAECAKYSNAKVCWVQEEPKNNGPWPYVQLRFHTCLGAARPVSYVGRTTSASPATGSKFHHKRELAQLYNAAMAL